MIDKKNKNIGCGKLILLLSAGLLILMVAGGALEGISNVFKDIPWYLNIFLSIGFIYLMIKLFGD